MDGPDLSHLLDGEDADRPSPAVLDSIVRRHRRLRAQRARAAATLGLVLALAGAGVGIGLSHQGTTGTALRGGQRSSTTRPLPESSGPAEATGVAPAGLGWVATGSEADFGPEQLMPSGTTVPLDLGVVPTAALRVNVSGAASSSTNGSCGVVSCPDYAFGATTLQHLFTRTRDGVTVRAFAAEWAVAPIALVPETSSGGSGTKSGHSSAGTGRRSGSDPPGSSRPESCALTRALLVEVSDAGAVGVVTVPLGPALAEPLDVLADEVVGTAEHSPIAVVVAHVSGATRAVRAQFPAGGRDEMNVVDRWAVLVQRLATGRTDRAAKEGTTVPGQAMVDALAGNGRVLEEASLPGSGALALAVEACGGGGNRKVPGSKTSHSAGSTPPAPSADANGP
jgi:hypothetical protein